MLSKSLRGDDCLCDVYWSVPLVPWRIQAGSRHLYQSGISCLYSKCCVPLCTGHRLVVSKVSHAAQPRVTEGYGSKKTRVQAELWITRLEEGRPPPKIQNPNIQKSKNPKFQKSRNPKIQNPKIEKSKNPKSNKISQNPKIQIVENCNQNVSNICTIRGFWTIFGFPFLGWNETTETKTSLARDEAKIPLQEDQLRFCVACLSVPEIAKNTKFRVPPIT